jgi:hypothetical protein
LVTEALECRADALLTLGQVQSSTLGHTLPERGVVTGKSRETGARAVGDYATDTGQGRGRAG